MGKDKKKKEKSKKKQKSGKEFKKSKEALLNEPALSLRDEEDRYDWLDWDEDEDEEAVVKPGNTVDEKENIAEDTENKTIGKDLIHEMRHKSDPPSSDRAEGIAAESSVKKAVPDTDTTLLAADTDGVQIPDAAVLVIFQALSDANRLKIMRLLSEREMCTSELLEAVDVVQSTMSHHMKVLCEAGLVSMRRNGKRSCYAVRRDTVEQLQAYLEGWKS